MCNLTGQPAVDGIGDLPIPVLVLNPQGSTVYENPAYRARFGSSDAQTSRALAAALRGGRASAIRAAMAGVSRAVPIEPTGAAPLDAHYFPVRDPRGAAVLVGVLL